MEGKSYGQFCGLARALDRIGDRWTLLVVRELLLGERSFRDLQTSLPGISPSLLTKRLTELVLEGLAERNSAPRRSRDVAYRLTHTGRSLEPVIVELIRWGSIRMLDGPGEDRVDPRWAPLALKALLEGQPASKGRVHLDVQGTLVTIASTGRRKITAGHHGRADAHVTSDLPPLLALAAGARPLKGSDVEISGDVAVAQDLLTATAARAFR